MLLAGALLVAPALSIQAAQATPDQSVVTEAAAPVEAVTEEVGSVVPPPVSTDQETSPEDANGSPDNIAETPDEVDISHAPAEVIDELIEAPAGTVSVTSDAETEIVLGQKISYTTTVANTGNVALTGLALTETSGVGAMCDSTALAVGAAVTCTSTHVVTQEDLDKFFVQNVVYGTAVSPTGAVVELNAGSVIDYAPRPLAAATLSFVSDAPGNADVVYGQKITYTITMTNTGEVGLMLVQHFSQSLSADSSCEAQTLRVGGTLTCTSVHWVTDVEVAAGSITNTIAIVLTGPAETGVTLGPATLTNRVLAAPVARPINPGDTQAQIPAAITQDKTYALANTGSENMVPVLLGAGAFLALGTCTLVARRRSKNT